MRKNYFAILGVLLIGLCGGVVGYAISAVMTNDSPTSPSSVRSEDRADEKEKKIACIAAMPLRTRIGQKIMAAGYSSYLQDETAHFAAASIGGVILMDEASAEQISAFRSAMPLAPLIAVDQEGGTVQRYKSHGILPGAEAVAEQLSPEDAYQSYLADSQRLHSSGITVNFAPVVDIASRTPTPLPGRMYANSAETVTKYAAAHVTAAQTAGITPVIKHFPGLGSATGNTDFTTATTTPLSSLELFDLLPYKELAALHPDAMIGNMIVPDLTDGQPAIWSRRAVTLLRSLGYQDAVIYSDSLTASAIPGSLEEAATKAWLAGVDVAVIVQSDYDTAHFATFFTSLIESGVHATESGDLSEDAINQSILRIFSRKKLDPCALVASSSLQ